MTLKYCEELALKLNISSKELQTALWFLHHGLGILLYYPMGDDLGAMIFCKVQAIYSSVTSLIKKTYTARYLQHESSLDEFANLGIFSQEEIENAPESSTAIPRVLLVQLLVHLNIITPAPPSLSPYGIENPYLMPCKLRCSRESIKIPSKGNPEPLKLRFKCGFTPVGVFPAMIAKLATRWRVLPERERIFKNRVRFRVGKDDVYMLSHLRYFEIAIVHKSCSSAAEVCCNVRQVFEGSLREVTVNMNYNFSVGHEYAFWCVGCANRGHLAVVVKEASPPSVFLECCQDKEVIGDLNPRQEVWFSESKLWMQWAVTLVKGMGLISACCSCLGQPSQCAGVGNVPTPCEHTQAAKATATCPQGGVSTRNGQQDKTGKSCTSI
jgi:hypothetical protein